MEDTLKYRTALDRRLQLGWKLGAVLLLVILFLVGSYAHAQRSRG